MKKSTKLKLLLILIILTMALSLVFLIKNNKEKDNIYPKYVTEKQAKFSIKLIGNNQ